MVMVTVLSLELMRRAIRFWGPVVGKEASLDALQFSLLGACCWQGGEFKCVWISASVLAYGGARGFQGEFAA